MFRFFRKAAPPPVAALALGGGGARGYGHIGVLRAFEEEGIDFPIVTGTSVGAMVGSLYAFGFDAAAIEDFSEQIKETDIRNSKIIFIPSKSKNIEDLVNGMLGGAEIGDLRRKFACVAVDINSGEEVVFRSGNVGRCVAASCSVPGVFTTTEIDGRNYVDGGLLNPIPTDVARRMGADVVIGVDINATRGGGTESDNVLGILIATFGIAMKSAAAKGIANADLMITPDLKRFRATRLKGGPEMIEEGYRAAKERMPEIRALLNMPPANR